jgi:beta-galactosidase GanA
MGLKPLLADVPGQVEVTCRTKGTADFYFLLNHADSPVTVTVGSGFKDILTGKDSTGTVTLPSFGYEVLKRERTGESASSAGFAF